MESITLFGEKDYKYKMQTVVRKFLKKHVRQGYFKSYDNTRIHYYEIKHENEKGVIVISHGFCEFFYKYHEMSYYYYKLGYSVYFIDHRGHGYSQRATMDKSKVYIKSYKQYVKDLKYFMDKIVVRRSPSDNYILFAHSMGGAIGAMFLEMYPGYFKKAVLSSPLMKMKVKGCPDIVIYIVTALAQLFGIGKCYAYRQHAFDGINIFENSSCMSRQRYDYMFDARKMYKNYQTYGGTYAWAKASVVATKYIIRHAGRIKIPVLLCQAGCDSMVDSKGQDIFAKKSHNTIVRRFRYSKHEIFNATGSIRKSYYREVFSFISKKKQIFNPYLPSCEYIPDGEPRVFGDRLYIYGSHDKFNGKTYCENDYVCWSAPLNDLSDWKYEGVIYKKSSHPYKTGRCELFAPDVVKGVDGRYYLYYSMAHSSVISVAVCDTPAGEYRYLSDVKDKDGNVIGNSKGNYYQFDPAVLVDDDKRVYLYSGFNPEKEADEEGILYAGCHVCELENDMYTVKTAAKLIINKHDYSEYDAQYFEAPSIRKINSLYYLVYSVRCGGLHYCYSRYPDKDYVYGGRLHSTSDVGINGYTVEHPAYPVGNTHGGIACINGKYYIFDHRLTNNSSYCRQGVAERIIIEKNGHIKQAESTSCGLNNAPLKGSGTYPSYIACNLVDRNVYKDKDELGEKRMCITQDGCDWNFDRENILKNKYKMSEKYNKLPMHKHRPEQYIHNVHNNCTVGFKYFNIKDIKNIVLKIKGNAKGCIIVTADTDVLTNVMTDNRCGASEINLSDNSTKPVKITVPVDISAGINPIYISFFGEGAFDFYEFELQ